MKRSHPVLDVRLACTKYSQVISHLDHLFSNISNNINTLLINKSGDNTCNWSSWF